MEQTSWDCVSTKTVRALLAKYALESWNRVPRDVVYNAWRHKPYSYFPEEDTRPTEFQDNNFQSSDEEDEDEDEAEDTHTQTASI